jgi:3-oxoacyl-[acyl-carrier-protein] synthase III
MSLFAADKDQSWYSTGELSVLGTGFALPGAAISTEQLLQRVLPLAPGLSRSDLQQVARLLAIDTRHISRSFHARAEKPDPGQRNPELAARALSAALDSANVRVDDLGFLIGHTATPAQPLPSNISFVADLVGYGGPHVELRQACTGFANALLIAFGLLLQPNSRPVAIVGSETGSLFFDPVWAVTEREQLVNLVQMGDGAAAIIVGPSTAGRDRLRSAWYGTIGLGRPPALEMLTGGSDCPASGTTPSFRHDYKTIAERGCSLFEAGVAAAKKHSVAIEQMDCIIPHQVSGHIGRHLARKFDIAAEKVFVNADRVGNTGSAAVWLALAQFRDTHPKSGTRALALGAESTKYMHGGFVYEHG